MVRACHKCKYPISPLNRLVMVYDFGICCERCGCRMQISTLSLILNMFLSQLAAYLVMAELMAQRGTVFFILLEIWAFFVFLPLFSLVVFSVKRV